MFNETWGLTTKVGDRERYLPETKQKVASVYRLAKSLDATRLVEERHANGVGKLDKLGVFR